MILLDSYQLLSNVEKYSCSFTSFKLLLLNMNKTIDILFLCSELTAFKASMSDSLRHNGEVRVKVKYWVFMTNDVFHSDAPWIFLQACYKQDRSDVRFAITLQLPWELPWWLRG